LESYLAEPENQKRLRDLVNYYKATAAPGPGLPAENRDNEGAAIPTRQGISANDRRREEWQRMPLAELPDRLFELEQRLNCYISQFGKTLDAITASLVDEGKDLDDIKRTLRLRLDDLRHTEFMLTHKADILRDDVDDFG
jgi:hypothetical protein